MRRLSSPTLGCLADIRRIGQAALQDPWRKAMNSRGVTHLCGIALFAGSVAITITTAQEAKPKAKHRRYRVVDVGTFGGPNADTLVPPPAAQILTNSGLFVGTAETKLADPFAPNCVDADCLVQSG